MRRYILAPIFALTLLLTCSIAVFAQSPHFVVTPTCTKSLTTGLTCSGKAAGLGNEAAFVFLHADSVSATYLCINNGGNTAPGQGIVTQNVTGPVTKITPHDGQITFTATLPAPPTPSPVVVCPNGNWTVHLLTLTYTNVVLHIQQPQGVDVLTFSFGTLDP